MLNLGDINFGLGVDTRRLNASVNDVVNFGRKVEEATNKAVEGSNKTAAALRRQEKATLAALQQTLNFNQQVRKAGAPTALIDANTRSFQEYAATLIQGKRSTLDFQRAQAGFQASMQKGRRELNQFKSSNLASSDSVSTLNDRIRNLTTATILVSGPLSAVGARIQALGSIATRSNIAMAGFFGGIAAGAFTLAKLTQGAIKTAIQMDKVNARLEAVTGSQIAANAAFERVADLADRTGSELVSVANGYARIQAAAKGTKLAGAEADKVFEDILFGAAKFRIGTEELNGVLKAFEQIMSKGIVQSEELRGQLGDRLTGAFNIAAQSMGKTTVQLNEMLKRGEVMSDEFLPKFAAAFRKAVGAEQTKRVEGLQASFNRLATSTTLFNKEFDETFGISKLFEGAVTGLTSVIKFFTNNMETLTKVAGAVAGGLVFLSGPKIITGFLALQKLIKGVTVSMLALNAAVLANPIGGLVSILTRVAGVAIGAVLGFTAIGTAMDDTKQKQRELIKEVEEYLGLVERQQKSPEQNALNDSLTRQQRIMNELTSAEAKLTKLQERRARIQGGASANNAQFARLNKINGAIETQNGFVAKLRALNKQLIQDEKDKKAAVEAAASAAMKATNGAITGAERQISRLKEEAAAIALNTGAVEALQSQFKNADNIEKFTASLRRAKLETAEVEKLTTDYTIAVEALTRAQQASALNDAAQQIKEINAQMNVLGKGSVAIERVNKGFANSKAVDSFRKKLGQTGIDLDTINTKADEFREALEAMDAAAAKLRVDTALGNASDAIEKLVAQNVALSTSAQAVKELQDQFNRSSAIKDFSTNLSAAGVSTQRAKGELDKFIAAYDALQESTRQADLNKALESSANALSTINAEITALGKGEDAFKAFQNAQATNKSLEVLSTNLRKAGVDEATITAKVEEHRQALEGLTVARAAYNDTLELTKNNSKVLKGGINADIDKINLQIKANERLQEVMSSGLTTFENLDRAIESAKSLDAYEAKLKRAGLSQDNVNLKLDEMRERIKVFNEGADKADQLRNNLDILASGYDNVADSLANAVVDGKNIFGTLLDTTKQVVKDMIAEFLKMQIIKPLLNSIFNPSTAGIFGGGSSGGVAGGIFGAAKGFLGGIFSRKGNVFSEATKMRKGGLLTKATAFSSASGPVIGGEAGAEAIVPLVRDSMGDLGVRMVGGGKSSSGPMENNFNFSQVLSGALSSEDVVNLASAQLSQAEEVFRRQLIPLIEQYQIDGAL